MNTQQHWQHIHEGYARVVIQGSVAPVSPLVREDNVPDTLWNIQQQLVAQAPSLEEKIVSEELYVYKILQIVPATSKPISELKVTFQISEEGKNSSRTVQLDMALDIPTLIFSTAQNNMWTASLKHKMPVGETKEESYQYFRNTVQTLLSRGFAQL